MKARCIGILIVLSTAIRGSSDPLDHWQLVNRAAPRFLRSVAEHDGLFVAVGVPAYTPNGAYQPMPMAGQIIVSSTNGIDWPTNYFSATGGLWSVVYGLQGWVVVGDAGAVLTSPEGRTWTTSRLSTTNNLGTIAYGNGAYVAAGGSSVWISTNASEWSASSANIALRKIVFGNGVFVGAGSSLFVSTNGVNWFASTNLNLSSLVYGDTGFFAARSGEVFQSVDGLEWMQVGTNSITLVGSAKGIVAGFDGSPGLSFNINTSPDGAIWTPRLRFSYLHSIFCVAGNMSLAVAVGSGMAVSHDGENWINQSSGMSGDLFGAGAAFGKLFCVGEYGDPGRMLISSDGGDRWIDADPPTTGMYSLAFGKSKLVGAGWSGGIYSSTNGQDWVGHYISTFAYGNLNSVAFGLTNFVAVGDAVFDPFQGNFVLVYSSEDGDTWTWTPVRDYTRLNSVVYGQNGFVAVGGSIFRSTRGRLWSQIVSGTELYEIAYGRGVYVAVGPAKVMISTNSVEWSQVSTTNSFSSITFGGGVFVALDRSGRIYTSTDALLWTGRTTVLPIWGVRYVDGLFLALGTGFDASIFRSDPLWKLSLSHGPTALTLSITGIPETSVRLQASPQLGSLASWSDEGIFTFSSDQLTIPITAGHAQRFYRTVPRD